MRDLKFGLRPLLKPYGKAMKYIYNYRIFGLFTSVA